MNRRATLAPLLVLCCLSGTGVVAADDSILPTMRFTADSLGNSLYDEIQHATQFQKMNREAVGSPFELRVYHTWRLGHGSALATGLLSAATLGIVPVVTSGEHAVVYEMLVNGVPVTSYKYQKTFTHAHNIWSGSDPTYGMGKEGLEWAKSTVALFLRDAAADPKLSTLSAEFAYYFAPAAPPSAPAH